jgi:F-type H+-transporting ATPase subunit gamma
MPSLIDIRRRIRSVKNTQQITKAMKMISAARLRRAQERVLAARPYSSTLRAMLADVAAAAAASGDEAVASNPLLARRPENRVELVVVTADRGLAGAFNTNLIRASQLFMEERRSLTVEFDLVGRKGRDFWRKRGVAVASERTGVSQKVQYSDAAEIAKHLIERYTREEIDSVYILYNEFKSLMAQKLMFIKILPIEVPEQTESRPDYIYEQPPAEILDRLLPRYVELAVYQAMLESAAAEHAARMTAMDSASTNAAEMIEKLTLYMNRVRQASITREIIEVVSGASALS